MFDSYLNKFMQSRQSSGPVWFETRDYIRWRPITNEGWLVVILFTIIFGWVVVGDLLAFSFGTLLLAGPILAILFYILCFIKGRKI